MNPLVDKVFRDRYDRSITSEMYIAGMLKAAGYWIVVSPDDATQQGYPDLTVRRRGRVLSHLEVKGRNLKFTDVDDFPYPDAALATRNSHKANRDYVVFSHDTNRCLVSPANTPRIIRLQNDPQRGITGQVYCATKPNLIDWIGFLDILKARDDSMPISPASLDK